MFTDFKVKGSKAKGSKAKVTVWRNYGEYVLNHFTADCSISVKFGTEFDYVTPSQILSRSQRENVVW